MKMAMPISAAIVAGGLTCFVLWKFQPFMPAGRGVHLGSWHVRDQDFQVWQRKNPEFTEPFATGLFVREPSGKWRAFCLRIEDLYAPRIVFREEDSGIAILRNGTKLGVFDQRAATLRLEPDGAALTGGVLDDGPPGNWWLK